MVVSIPAPQSHKQRLYKISESTIIDIMNASLVAPTNTEPTLKSDGILTDDGYEAVSKALDWFPVQIMTHFVVACTLFLHQ